MSYPQSSLCTCTAIFRLSANGDGMHLIVLELVVWSIISEMVVKIFAEGLVYILLLVLELVEHRVKHSA